MFIAMIELKVTAEMAVVCGKEGMTNGPGTEYEDL
jgi:hypothetical protein